MTTKLALHLQETTRLTGLDRATLVVMANIADENGELQTTSTALATELDCEPSEVRRSVKRLILLGCVSRHGDWFLVHGDDSVLLENNGGGTVSVSEPGGEGSGGLETQASPVELRSEDQLPLNDERSDETVPTVLKVEKRLQNQVFDALCAVVGYTPAKLSRQEKGMVIDGVGQILALGCGPQDVLDRANRWGKVYPGIPLTVASLMRHWSRMDDETDLKPVSEGLKQWGPDQPRPGFSHALDGDEVTKDNPNVIAMGGSFAKPLPQCNHKFVYNAAGVSTCDEHCIRPGFAEEAKVWLRIP